MPPPMPNPIKRMTANPARPVGRYRPGKPTHDEDTSDEEVEEVEEVEETHQQPVQKSQPKPRAHRPKAPIPQHNDEDDDDDEEGFETEDEEEEAQPMVRTKPSAQVPSDTTKNLQSIPVTIRQPEPSSKSPAGSGNENSENSEDEDEEGSSTEESSEDEAPQRKFQRPTFIKKTDRNQYTSTSIPAGTNGTSNPSQTPEEDEQARRKAQADLMIKDKLERDLLARAAGKKAWDDDDEVDPLAAVDDTDGLDPEAEYQAWRLRELKRLKRDREAIEAREREIEEVERRRNLSVAEREEEDRKFIDKQKEERDDSKGKANYLARYHHKGAFFQDDKMAEILKKRDIMGAKFVDEVSDKSTLPEYMRLRDMTKLGRKGRTRYTDLKGQDTGRFGDDVKRWRGAGDNSGRDARYGIDTRGLDERFLPDNDTARGPTGANASAVGFRRDKERNGARSRSRSPKRRERDEDGRDGGDSYRPRPRRRSSYSRSRSRSRSRSKTPPRRKRSPSPYTDKDKRRRIDVT